MFKKIKEAMAKKQDPTLENEKGKNQEIENGQENEPKSSKKKKKSSKQDKTKQELEETQAQKAELKDKYIRLLAEFDNYKKRTIKEKMDLMRTAAQDTMSALLPVLDDFDRAKKNAEDNSSAEPFSEGVMLVYNKLHGVLKSRGLEVMESDGLPFDPELHEAITEIPAPSEDMKGKVFDTVEKGYVLKDKIIRHAKVVVGK